jgi:hypothetical protein
MEGDLGMRNPDFTFSVTDAVGRHRPPNMDDATAIGHFILIGVLAGVVIIQGMHDAQVEKELIQNLRETEKKPLCDHSPLHCLHALLAPHTSLLGSLPWEALLGGPLHCSPAVPPPQHSLPQSGSQ